MPHAGGSPARSNMLTIFIATILLPARNSTYNFLKELFCPYVSKDIPGCKIYFFRPRMSSLCYPALRLTADSGVGYATDMPTSTLQKQSSARQFRFRILEEARDAVAKLRVLRPLLSPQDRETLAILMDQDLMQHLDKSLCETVSGKTEPLANILK